MLELCAVEQQMWSLSYIVTGVRGHGGDKGGEKTLTSSLGSRWVLQEWFAWDDVCTCIG